MLVVVHCSKNFRFSSGEFCTQLSEKLRQFLRSYQSSSRLEDVVFVEKKQASTIFTSTSRDFSNYDYVSKS